MLLQFLILLLIASLSMQGYAGDRSSESKHTRPNILIVTVDDMSADSLGIYGCELENTSPNIDAFARSAMRFHHAHVQVGNCMPGRNIMWSGLYAHRNGVEGFIQNPSPDYPVLCDLAREAGYFTAIRGKVSHSTPYSPYPWDAILDQDSSGKKYHVKDPSSYGDATRRGIEQASEEDKPFCLMVNISDPHKPFYNPGFRNGKRVDPYIPSQVFAADEVSIPGFLFDDPIVRAELALYYSSVRRADDAFAEIIRALREAGKEDDTVVFFCSDHGMPLPFAKTQLYYHSTRTPLIVRWPGVTTPDYVDNQHMVSAVDFLPTLLDVMGHTYPVPGQLQGRSFAPILRGEQQSGRDFVLLQYNQNSGAYRHPMRGIQTKEYLYLFNPWANGERKFATATTGTATYRRMKELAIKDANIARRLQLFDYRELEEFYNVSDDPDCLKNLIGYTEQQKLIQAMRGRLEESLSAINDPVASVISEISTPGIIDAYMHEQDRKTEELREKRRQNKGTKPSSQTKLPGKSLRIQIPSSVSRGKECQVKVTYDVPKHLGSQALQVTLKRSMARGSTDVPERIDRKSQEISGKGIEVFSFIVPENLKVGEVRFAAFIGKEFSHNLVHKISDSIKVQEN